MRQGLLKASSKACRNTKLFKKSCLSGATAVALLAMSGTINAQVMLGASLPNDGFSRDVIANFNNTTPKNLAYVNVFSSFSHDWDLLYWQSRNVVLEGAMPVISWMPIDLDRPDDNLLPEIVLGYWDEYLIQWGTKMLAWRNSYPSAEQPRLAIRFAHEFNGNWYPYSNTPIAYQAAWQHIHDLFSDMGVNDHVDWIWSASKTNVDDYNDFSVYYPGNEYVDWTSLDGYNWGSNYVSGGWTEFKDVFAQSYGQLVEMYPDKPIMIAETASAEPSDIPNTLYGMYGDNSDANESKTDWIQNMLAEMEVNFPAVRAVSIFNINKELNWSMTEQGNTGLDAWISGTQSAHYTSDVLVASQTPTVSEPDVTEPVVSEPTNDRTNKGKRKGKNKDATLASSERRTRGTPATKLIGANSQRELARQKAYEAANNESNEKLAAALRALGKEKRDTLKAAKLSVINY